MARYPQGVRSYIPQIQSYESDFTFLAKALQYKQGAYDKNYEALNKLYGKLYYADLSHEDNKAKQQQLIREIDFNLNRVANLDLSLDKNVQQAKQVFQPFYEDKNLLYDMAATSNVKSAIAGANSLKASTKEEEYNRWWQTGVDFLNYKLEEFKETPVDQLQATGLANQMYTPYVNLNKIALDYAKELGIEAENVSWSPDGRYRITTTNGQPLQQPLARLFESVFANDPRVQEVYKTQAYVNRKNAAYGNAANFGGDRNAAEMNYLKDKYNYLKSMNEQRQLQLESQSNVYASGIKRLQDKYNKTKDPLLLNSIKQLEANKEIVDVSLANAQSSFGLDKDRSTLSTSAGFVNPYGDIETLRRRVDSGMANVLMRDDLNEAAINYADTTRKIDIEKDEYKYLEIEQGYYDRRQQRKLIAEKDAANLKFLRDIQLKDIDKKLESGAYEIQYDERGMPSVVLSDDMYAKTEIQAEGSATSSEVNLLGFVETNAKAQANKAIASSRLVLKTVEGAIKNNIISSQEVRNILGTDVYTFEESLSADAILSGKYSPLEKESFARKMGELKQLLSSRHNQLSSTEQSILQEQFNLIEGFNLNNNAVTTAKIQMANAVSEAALQNGYYGAQFAFDEKGNRRSDAEIAASMLEQGYIFRDGELIKGAFIPTKDGTSFVVDSKLLNEPPVTYFSLPPLPAGGVAGINTLINTFIGVEGGGKLMDWVFGDNRTGMQKLNDAIDKYSRDPLVVGKINVPYASGTMSGGLASPLKTTFKLVPGQRATPGYQAMNEAYGDVIESGDYTNLSIPVTIGGNTKTAENAYFEMDASAKQDFKTRMGALTKAFVNDMKYSKNLDQMLGSTIEFNNMFAGDISRGSVVFKPSKEWLEAYAGKATKEGEAATAIGLITPAEGLEIIKNGVTWVGNIQEFENNVHANRLGDPYKNYVDQLPEGQSLIWTALDPNYKAEISKNNLGLDGYNIEYTIPFMNNETGQVSQVSTTDFVTITGDGFGLSPAIETFNKSIYDTYKPLYERELQIYNNRKK
jgi:hypothetical protein